ncbi:MAG: DUF4494 domain-containing protein [Phocaeicola sp.]
MIMDTWFLCTVKYRKRMEDGLQKRVSEKYLFDSISFTESEGRCIEEMAPFVSGDFEVADIKKAKFSKVVLTDNVEADRYYKCKLEFITLDEKSGKGKKHPYNILIQAVSIQDAQKRLDDWIKGSMTDIRIVSITETPIMDVYRCKSSTEDKDNGN